MRPISYQRASDVEHAITLSETCDGSAQFIAGGQSLVNMMKQRVLAADTTVIDIGDLRDELSYVRRDDDYVRIGAMTTHTELLESAQIEATLPGLHHLVSQVGDVQVRNMGTIGGDVAHADPSSDYPVYLLAMESEFESVGPDGKRSLSADEFFTDYFTTALSPSELLTEVRIPIPSTDWADGFDKFAERDGDFAIINSAVSLWSENGVCENATVYVGSVGAVPVESNEAAASLTGRELSEIDPAEAGEGAFEEIVPDPDDRVSDEYKRQLLRATVKTSVQNAIDNVVEE